MNEIIESRKNEVKCFLEYYKNNISFHEYEYFDFNLLHLLPFRNCENLQEEINVFKNYLGIEIENFFYAIIAALILSGLNYTIKPILIYWTLPLSVMTFGIAYPIVNMIILKLCDIIMGSSFNINGFFATFVIAIFISGLKIILDNIITKNVGR